MAFRIGHMRSARSGLTSRPGLAVTTFFQLFLIMVTGLIAYSNTFHVPFHFDDDFFIVGNPYIKELRYFTDLPKGGDFTVEYLKGSFSAYSFRERLAGYFTFALNYRLNGLDVTGYHIVNLFIHVLNAILIYWFVLLTFRTPGMYRSTSGPSLSDRSVAFFAGLLFIAHPVQTQAVTYITQRFASLATLFYLLSIVLYVVSRLSLSRLKRYALYGGSVVSAIFAIKTKQISFTIPLTVVLYELIFFQEKAKDRLLRALPLILIVLIIPVGLIWTGGSFGELIDSLDAATRVQSTASRLDYLFTQFRVIVTYLRLLFLPFNQTVDYDYPMLHSFLDARVFLSFMTIALILGLGGYVLYRSGLRGRHGVATVQCFRLVAFGIFWFFVTLSVESSLIPIVDIIFEHRVYLPSVGFSIAFTSALFWAGQKMKGKLANADIIVSIALAVMVATFTATTYVRNIVWGDPLSLWTDVLTKAPLKDRGHFQVAKEYKKRGQLEAALVEYRKAAVFGKNAFTLADTWNNIGRIYHQIGATDLAEDSYKRATRLNPHHSIACNNLGLIYEEKGFPEEAIKEFRLSIRNNPDYAFAHFNLARVLKEKGLYGEADAEFKKAFELGLDVPGIRRDMLLKTP